MSHFEEILKVIGLMKNFTIKCDPHVTQQTGNHYITITNMSLIPQGTSHHYQPLRNLE